MNVAFCDIESAPTWSPGLTAARRARGFSRRAIHLPHRGASRPCAVSFGAADPNHCWLRSRISGVEIHLASVTVWQLLKNVPHVGEHLPALREVGGPVK